MASNKKPKKKYRPKPVLLDPIAHVLVGIRPPAPEHRARIEIVNHGAMYQLTHGKGTRQDWDEVACALNTALVLAEDYKIGFDYLADIQAALEAHRMCGVRGFGYSGPELQTVNYALKVHEEQMNIATVSEHERALAKVLRSVFVAGRDICVKEKTHEAD